MKVCYVTHLPNLTGASQSLLDILSHANSEGIEPVVLLGKHGPIEAELKKRGVRYAVISYSSEITERSALKNLAKHIKSSFALGKVMKFFREENFDIIHSNSELAWVGMEAAYRLGIPYICHIRDYVFKMLHEKRQHFLINNSAVSIAISKTVKSKYKPFVPKADIRVLPDGIVVERYHRPHGEILNSRHTELLLAGRIEPGKGQLDAIKAIEYLSRNGKDNFTLKIVGGVGDSDYDRMIREYVRDNKLEQVKFIDFTDLSELRAECDIGLVCSSSEALGRVTIESMLAGMLTIGANAGATPEIISDEVTGLLYESGNGEDLARKIMYAVSDPEAMRRIVAAGQKYAYETFDSKKYIAELAKLYHEILEK